MSRQLSCHDMWKNVALIHIHLEIMVLSMFHSIASLGSELQHDEFSVRISYELPNSLEIGAYIISPISTR